MPTKDHTTTAPVFNRQNPATWLKPDEPLIGADGRDWSWAYVWFKDVPGYPGYKVGADGSAWSCRTSANNRVDTSGSWKPLKAQVANRTGHRRVQICGHGEVKRWQIHRLVLEAFVGPCPPGHVARHFPDRDTANNRLSNLQWSTQSENLRDRDFHGTSIRGTRNGRARLNEDLAARVRTLYLGGRTPQSIADEVGVGITTVRRVLHGETWSDGNGSIVERRVRSKINRQLADEMRAMHAAGASTYKIADHHGVSQTTVCNVIRGLAWADG